MVSWRRAREDGVQVRGTWPACTVLVHALYLYVHTNGSSPDREPRSATHIARGSSDTILGEGLQVHRAARTLVLAFLMCFESVCGTQYPHPGQGDIRPWPMPPGPLRGVAFVCFQVGQRTHTAQPPCLFPTAKRWLGCSLLERATHILVASRGCPDWR